MAAPRQFSLHDPSLWFVAYLIIVTISGIGFHLNPHTNVELALKLKGIALGFIAAVWVQRDAAKSRSHFPSDLVFQYWFVLFPVYLLSTKKWRGLLRLLLIVFLLGCTLIMPEILRAKMQS